MATQEIVWYGFSFNTHEQSGFVFKTVPKLSSSKMKLGVGGEGLKILGKNLLGDRNFWFCRELGYGGANFSRGRGGQRIFVENEKLLNHSIKNNSNLL